MFVIDLFLAAAFGIAAILQKPKYDPRNRAYSVELNNVIIALLFLVNALALS